MIGKVRTDDLELLHCMQTQGLIIRIRENKHEIDTPLGRKKKATFHIYLFSFSCNMWLTRNGIMNKKIVTKRLVGIGWRRLMTCWGL